VNGLRPFGDMASLITVAERLRALQTELVAFSETNVEWQKYELRENMQKLFTKAFGAARMEYCTSSNKFETTYHKRGGTTCGDLVQMVHRVIALVRDGTGCGRWSQIKYAAKESKKMTIISAYGVCKQTNPGDLTASKQKHEIMYEDEEMRPYLVDPHKQTLIYLQYHVEKLKTDGHEVLIFMDSNQVEEQVYQAPTHNENFVTQKSFHVDGSIDGSLQSFIQNCQLINVLRRIHEGVVPNTHARGSSQIYFPLIISGLDEHVVDVGLLYRSILKSHHSGMSVDLRIEGIFGQHPDKLAPHQFRNLKLDDPIISDKYRKILHKQFENQNVYRRVKEISVRGKEEMWNLMDETIYEKLYADISEAMKHAERMCNLHKVHDTPWAKSLVQATHTIRYWDVRISRRGTREYDDGVVNYYLAISNVDKERFDITMPITACIHQLNNARRQLKDVLKEAANNGAFYEVEVATARVEKSFLI
jgi:hypothetical protein